MVDSFQRLRHNAVVGRHHQNDDIGDFGAAGTHARERFVAWRIDKNDFAAVLLDVVGADMLRDTAGLAIGDMRRTDGIEQRSFAMIHVAHDGDHRRAPDAIGALFSQRDLLRALLFVADLVGGRAKLARQILSHLHVEVLIDGGENFLLHQFLN